MKKISLVCLLIAAMLFSACEAESNDNASTTASATSGQAETSVTKAETTVPSVSEGEVTTGEDEPLLDVPTEDGAFADLLTKYPIVSELKGSFASAKPTDLIEDGLKKVEEMEGGVVQIGMSMSMDMGMLGGQEEKMSMTLIQDGDDYRSLSETTSTLDGETYTTLKSDTFVDGTYYYLYQSGEGEDEIVEKYKIPLSVERFEEYISGDSEGIEDVSDADLGQIADMIGNALKTAAGMTEDGGCVYFAKGFNTDALKDLELFADMTDEIGDYLSDDCLDNISFAVTIDKDGALNGIYIDMPIEISIEEGEFSMSMTMSITMELTVRPLTEADKIEAPEDADSYETLTEEDLFAWLDDEEPDEGDEVTATPSADDDIEL